VSRLSKLFVHILALKSVWRCCDGSW
jgi:hypothetical protein